MTGSDPTRTPPSVPVPNGSDASQGPTLVRLNRIDLDDVRFQLRVKTEPESLMATLEADGQQSPVVLWEPRGSERYKIVDGFHRIEAISRLGRQEVLAVIRRDIDQTEALSLSFLLNAHRRNLTPLDKAHAVSRAIGYFGMSKPMVAQALGLSVRQINRYLAVLQFNESVQTAVDAGRITLQHAAILHRHRVATPNTWIDTIETEALSSRELGRRLRLQSASRSTRPYLVRDQRGFRLAPIRYRKNARPAETDKIRKALESALKLLP